MKKWVKLLLFLIIIALAVCWAVYKQAPDFFNGLVTLSPIIAALFALFIAGGGGEYLKPLFSQKPELKFLREEIRSFDQNGSDHWRIALKNIGNVTAKNVQCDVTQVTEVSEPRKNFISVPLEWTHRGGTVRDIVRDQTAWLDMIIFERSKTPPTLTLSTPHSGGVKDFKNLVEGPTEIRLTVYLENGRSFNQKILVKWNKSSVIATWCT